MPFSLPFPTARLLALLALLALSAPLLAQGGPTADERLRAIYTREWTWRQQQTGREVEGFPRVDAATQAT